MTEEELLALALHGSDDWDKLYEACRDRDQAEALARMLERRASAENTEAAAWAQLLGEMHAGLKVNLRAGPSSLPYKG
jgi:hypothetical protein